jgi:hypothetical protein
VAVVQLQDDDVVSRARGERLFGEFEDRAAFGIGQLRAHVRSPWLRV